MDVYLRWIVDTWDSLPKELITRSFKVCGISNAVDGSEDDLIHCFKPEGSCPEGRRLLANEHLKLSVSLAVSDLVDLVEEIDLYQDNVNGYISDESLEL
uniref:Uncharacterized protein n=1 Tax=Plectus sambesii TaxID=2011161 RepID=A0A914UPP5_9BILA